MLDLPGIDGLAASDRMILESMCRSQVPMLIMVHRPGVDADYGSQTWCQCWLWSSDLIFMGDYGPQT